MMASVTVQQVGPHPEPVPEMRRRSTKYKNTNRQSVRRSTKTVGLRLGLGNGQGTNRQHLGAHRAFAIVFLLGSSPEPCVNKEGSP
jgi:hypothetical protein